MVKGILFNTEMVRAILDGRKTVTRRVVKPQPEVGAHSPYEGVGGCVSFRMGERGCTDAYNPPYRKGDTIYVRETWKQAMCDPAGGGYALTDLYLYKADEPIETKGMYVEDRWHPSIHMPKEAARLFLRVKDVRVSKLQYCGNMEAKDEGCTCCSQFARIWDSTIKKADLPLYGWTANPWVWVIKFERIEKA